MVVSEHASEGLRAEWEAVDTVAGVARHSLHCSAGTMVMYSKMGLTRTGRAYVVPRRQSCTWLGSDCALVVRPVLSVMNVRVYMYVICLVNLVDLSPHCYQ